MKINLIILILCISTINLASCGANCGANYTPPVDKKIICSEIFQIFHKCTGRFLEVALDTANPFTLCTNNQAYGFYRNLTFFLNLLQENYDRKTNIRCSDEYLNKNQMSVISHIVSTSKGIWETANCDDCYDSADSSANNQNFSRFTIEFQQAHDNYTSCTNNYQNASVICKECMVYYIKMNELFDHAKSKREGKICFDLEDIMNKTRQEWSGVYGCCRNKMDSLKAFYSLFSTIIILAIAFYLTIYATGSCYSEPPTLDASEILNFHSVQANTSSSSSTMSSLKPKDTAESEKNLIINEDDSDDESNILNEPSPINTNQIILSN